MTTTYCIATDVAFVLSESGILNCLDDDEDGTLSAAEETYLTNAIERGGVECNTAFGRQYHPLSQLADNDWAKWANAVLASGRIATRRGNPLPQSLADDVKEVKEYLTEIAWGRRSLPEQAPSYSHRASVSNFRVELYKAYNPVRTVLNESTGETPPTPMRQNVANVPGAY